MLSNNNVLLNVLMTLFNIRLLLLPKRLSYVSLHQYIYIGTTIRYIESHELSYNTMMYK